MKIRSGFVSNSSSSSFIVSSYSLNLGEAEKDILTSVVRLMKNYGKRNGENLTLDNYKKRCYINGTDEEKILNSYNKYKEYMKNYYSEDYIRENVHVSKLQDVREKLNLDFWYAGNVLYDDKYVIWDESDNYIPEEVAKKIIKKYLLGYNEYNLHMG